jgi:hypothetical protein
MEQHALDSIIAAAKGAIPTDLSVREALRGYVDQIDPRNCKKLAREAFDRLLKFEGQSAPKLPHPYDGSSNPIAAFARSPDLAHVDHGVAALWGVFTPAVSAYPMLASLGLGQVVSEISDLAGVFFPQAGRDRFRRIIRTRKRFDSDSPTGDSYLLALAGLTLERSALRGSSSIALQGEVDESLPSLARWVVGDKSAADAKTLLALCFFAASTEVSQECSMFLSLALGDISSLHGEFEGLTEKDCSKVREFLGCNVFPGVSFIEQVELFPKILSGLLAHVVGDGSECDGDLLCALAHVADLQFGAEDDFKEGYSQEFYDFATKFSEFLRRHRTQGANGSSCSATDLFTLLQSRHLIWFGGGVSDLDGLSGLDISMLLSVNQDGDLDESEDFGWWKRDSEEFRAKLFQLQLDGLVEEGFHLQAEALACVYLVTELQVARRGGRAISELARLVRRSVPSPWKWIPALASQIADAVPETHLSAKLILRGLASGVDSMQLDAVRRVAERNLLEILGSELWLSLPIEMKVAFREREREWLDAQRANADTDFGHFCTAYFKPYEAEILRRVIGTFSKGEAETSSEGLEWCKKEFGGRFNIDQLTVDSALKLLRAQVRGEVPPSLGERLGQRFRGMTASKVKLLFNLKQLRNEGTHAKFSLDDLRRARSAFLSPESVKSIRDLLY